MNSKNNINSNQIGEIVATARKVAGLSQIELAQQLGINKRSISAYETGVRRIHAARLVEIAKILNISLDALTGQGFSKIDGRTRSAYAIRELDQLPEQDQKLVFGMIDSLASKQTATAK